MGTSAQTVLSGIALIIMGSLGGFLVFHAVPVDNRELLSVIIGAIGGALTFAGGNKLASTLSAPNATVNVDPQPK